MRHPHLLGAGLGDGLGQFGPVGMVGDDQRQLDALLPRPRAHPHPSRGERRHRIVSLRDQRSAIAEGGASMISPLYLFALGAGRPLQWPEAHAERLVKREAGYERPIYLHGALAECCALYESFGVRLGPLKSATGAKREEMRGEIVLAPPSAIADRWSRRLPDPVTAFASGWMRVRARARQQGVELPLVISDHADWGELTETIAETGAEEIWVTHGREDALLHHIQTTGRKGRALALVGREDEDQ